MQELDGQKPTLPTTEEPREQFLDDPEEPKPAVKDQPFSGWGQEIV